MIAIFQALLVGLELFSKFFAMYQKRQIKKGIESKIAAKAIVKANNAREKVKNKLRDRYPEFMD